MIGADSSLRSPAPKRNAFSLGQPAPPPMIPDGAVQDSVNNMMAAGAGQQRAAMTGMDRAGLSRGRGHQSMADYAAASSDAKARAGAAQVEMEAAGANAAARNAYENARNQERLMGAGLLENLRNTQAMEQIARRGFGQDMYEANRRGQFGLDSQYLDLSPLLSALLR